MGRDGQVSALALFSEELRRARSAAGLTQDQLAERVGYSPSLVAHVETGSRAPSLDFARRGDEALGTGGLLARLQPFVRSEPTRRGSGTGWRSSARRSRCAGSSRC